MLANCEPLDDEPCRDAGMTERRVIPSEFVVILSDVMVSGECVILMWDVPCGIVRTWTRYRLLSYKALKLVELVSSLSSSSEMT